MARMRLGPLRPLSDGDTYRRWAFLILGGALLVPFVILANALGVLVEELVGGPAVVLWAGIVMGAGTLTALVSTASLPVVREVMTTGARELLRGPMSGVVAGQGRSWPDRLRSSAWLLTHILIGGVISVLSVAVPAGAVVAIIAPWAGPPGDVFGPGLPIWRSSWAPLAGVLAVVALLYLVAGAGHLLARLAPVLLGPSPEERLAAAERRAADLAQRNRLARELHDSVGHALSVVTTQAGAASRVLSDNPEFAGQALRAIESQARMALEDLDHVLGLLREETPTAPTPTLADLQRLLADTRAAGMTLDATVDGDLDRLPRVVSREAFRIVQECLTNALRHAPGAPVTLRVTVADGHLGIVADNPVAGDGRAGGTDRRDAGRSGAGPRVARVGSGGPGTGGRGLTGIAERVDVLGGTMTVAAENGRWRVVVRIPLEVKR